MNSSATLEDVGYFETKMKEFGCTKVLPFGNMEEFQKNEIIYSCPSEDIKVKITSIEEVSSSKINILEI